MKARHIFFFMMLAMCCGFIKPPQSFVHIRFEGTHLLAIGEQLKVNVRIMNAQDVSGYESQVGFDPTALHYIEIGQTWAAKQDFHTALGLATQAGDVKMKNHIKCTLRLLE